MGNHCWVFAVLIIVSPLTSAEIFKCTDSKGNVKYQNFPCQIDSIGSAASALPPNQDDVRNAEMMKVPSRPVTKVDEMANANDERKVPRVGMTRDSVRRSLWGEPMRVDNTEMVEGAVEIWHYDDTRTVQFDGDGRVFLVEQ